MCVHRKLQIKKVDALPGSGAWPSYNERFQRMWDFYLCNCEAEFTTGHFGLGQFILRCPSKDLRGEVSAATTPSTTQPYQHQALGKTLLC